MGKALDAVVDAVDIETFILGEDETKCLNLARGLMEELGFSQYDVVSLQHRKVGARVRLRAYVNRPGQEYTWLKKGSDRR